MPRDNSRQPPRFVMYKPMSREEHRRIEKKDYYERLDKTIERDRKRREEEKGKKDTSPKLADLKGGPPCAYRWAHPWTES